MSSRISPPSAHDVARRAGVSQAAVSRSFTPGASVSARTREKVLVAAKELGYRPNFLARSLKKSRSDIIGVVVGNPRNPFFVFALDLLSSRLREAGRHLLVFTGESDASADLHVEDLLKYRVDGLVLMWTSISAALAKTCELEGIPLVFVNRRANTTENFASVAGANAEGSKLIADHLLQQGYRKLAFISGLEDSSTNREREAAFLERVRTHGLPSPQRSVGNFRREPGMAATRELLNQSSRPDAIFCANDIMALGAIDVARHEFGLEVGREIGIAGFDDIEQACWPSYQLTTYSQPIDSMIETVADLLLDRDRYDAHPQLIMPGELKIRGSTTRN